MLDIEYSDMLKLTLKELENIGKAYYEKEENELNKRLYIAHQEAVLIGIAQNNPKRFPSKAPTVKRNSIKEAETPEAIYNMITAIGQTFSSKSKPTD